MNNSIKKVLLDEETIQKRVKELADQISNDYKDEGVMFIGILKGSIAFMADLMKAMSIDIQIDFMAVSSYGASTKSTGVVRILKDLDADIKDKNILIIEDIIDTGTTLKYLVGYLNSRGPKSIKICSLLDKPERRKADVKADYMGFTIPDEFVVGYGLDYAEWYRGLPYIGILKEEVYKNDKTN
jgi:hypoxanthine phosphoribosyltransferase